MTELGYNTPLGRGGSLLTVVIIRTRLLRPANVSRSDGQWGGLDGGGGGGSVFACFYYCTDATGAERRATKPLTEVDS